MTIIQKIHLAFKNGSKKGIIIEEYKNQYLVMLCDEGFYGTYCYITNNTLEPKFFETALEVIEKYIDLWSENTTLVKVESTNEFVKIEKLQELYPEVEVLHV